MKNCNVVYPHRLVRPLGRNVIDHKEQLQLFLGDIIESKGKIETFVGDNPKRSGAKMCLCFSSNYPCEYCYSKGHRYTTQQISKKTEMHFKHIREKIKSAEHNSENLEYLLKKMDEAESELKPAKRSHIVWPSVTRLGEPRTKENVLEIVEKVERSENKLPPDEAKGVVGRSPLFEVPDFDIVRDVPAEYLHSNCLGVTKRLVELTFDVGEKRKKESVRKLSSPKLFNTLMQNVKVPSDFPRRIRELDFAVMKGSEFRNLVIFFSLLCWNALIRYIRSENCGFSMLM